MDVVVLRSGSGSLAAQIALVGSGGACSAWLLAPAEVLPDHGSRGAREGRVHVCR